MSDPVVLALVTLVRARAVAELRMYADVIGQLYPPLSGDAPPDDLSADELHYYTCTPDSCLVAA